MKLHLSTNSKVNLFASQLFGQSVNKSLQQSNRKLKPNEEQELIWEQ